MKITKTLRRFASTRNLAALAVTAACAGLLTGCATSADSGFKFTVFHYKEPVKITSWDYTPSRNDSPETAGLNVATLITHGDVDQWLTRWNASERPNISAEDRAALQQKWLPLKNGRLALLDCIVSGMVTVMEFSVETTDHQVEKLQVPLVHADNQWEMTSVDPKSDFLNWEKSSNKIVSEVESSHLLSYLNQPAKLAPQAKL